MALLFRAGLSFEDVFFFNCFLLTVLPEALAGLLREAFFDRFEAVVFGFDCLLFFFLFFDAMGAV